MAAGSITLVLLAVLIGPRFLPYQTYSVLSGSMAPAIEVGSLIVLRPVAASDIEVGDVITYSRPDQPGLMVTHRVVRIDEGPTGPLLVTRGDANGTDDAWRVPATGDGWRHAFTVPHLGRVLAGAQGPAARLLLVVVPAVALGLQHLVGLWRPRRPALGTAAPTALR